jgi:hypothetical protein
MADEEVLWPLRAVSKDASNLTKLDATGNVLTSTVDVDARYVIKAGDTMTGQLTVAPAALVAQPAGHVQIVGDGFGPSLAMRGFSSQGVFRLSRSNGTVAAPTAITSGAVLGVVQFLGLRPDGVYAGGCSIQGVCDADTVAGTGITGRLNVNINDAGGVVGVLAAKTNQFIVTQRDPRTTTGAYNALLLTGAGCSMWGSGPVTPFDTGFNADENGLLVMRSPKAEFVCTESGEVFVVSKQAGRTNENIFFYRPDNGNLAFQDCKHFTIGGVGSLTYGFECNTDSIFRDNMAVNGNISSTGTAHSFAAGSIPSPAVIGNVPLTIAATGSAGSAGQMVWDDNFIYLRTTAGWKKVALTAI